MDEKWIWLWVKCLSLNKAYTAYCRTQTAELEQQHPLIKDIYNDFGPLPKPLRADGSEWQQWLEAHSHLFYRTTITVGPKTTTTEPRYKLALKRAGAKQQQAVRKRLMAYTVLGPITGKSVHKKWQGKVQPITKTLFIKLAMKQQLWRDDWDEWESEVTSDFKSDSGVDRTIELAEYKRMTIALVKQAEKMIAGTIEGKFP